MPSLKDYYKLKRDAFSINPRRDSEVYFGGANINGRIRERLQTDFLEERSVPKFFIFGQYGAGKSHTLGHIKQILERDPTFEHYLSEVRLTELPPMRPKDTWEKIHGQLVDELGRDLIRTAAKALIKNAPDDVEADVYFAQEGVAFGDSALKNSQAQIYRALLFQGRQETVAWDWLKGRALTKDEKSTLGVETDLTGPVNYLNALLNLATLIHKGLGKKVVLLIDEAEALRGITDPGSVEEFINVVRRIMDNDNDVLGMICAFQNEGGMEDAPGILMDEAIRRRVGHEHGYIDLSMLVGESSDVRDFITEVLHYLVDQEAAKELLEAEKIDLDPAMFPFTVEAIEALAQYVMEEPGRQVPSQIISKMSSAVARAYLSAQDTGETCRLVDEDILNGVLYPEDV